MGNEKFNALLDVLNDIVHDPQFEDEEYLVTLDCFATALHNFIDMRLGNMGS